MSFVFAFKAILDRGRATLSHRSVSLKSSSTRVFPVHPLNNSAICDPQYYSEKVLNLFAECEISLKQSLNMYSTLEVEASERIPGPLIQEISIDELAAQ